MPRPRKKTETPKISNSLLEALSFLSIITKDVGSINETHVSLKNNWAIATNGILSGAHKIEQELEAAPNNALFIQALSKCGQNFSITQLENKLSIKSDKFKAFVPCIDQTLINIPTPDPYCAVITNEFKTALEAVSVLVNENANQVYKCSILLNGQSVVATLDGHVLFEYWHGIDLPTNISIPKTAATALSNTKKNLVGFGFSQSSVTFYFEDESWIKSQLYNEQWPDISKVLGVKANMFPVPKDLFEGLAAVTPFSEDGLVRFDDGAIKSSKGEARYDVPGLPSGPLFSSKQLALLKGWVEEIDFFAPGMTLFRGGRMRGAIANRSE